MKLLRLLLLTLIINQLSIINANAQWQPTGPYIGYIACMATKGATIFAGTYEGGMYVSNNYGASWTAANNGITGGLLQGFTSIAISGNNVFASTLEQGIYLSTNNGASWVPVDSGIPLYPDFGGYHFIYGITASGNNIFAAVEDSGVYLSTNNGVSWKAVNNGITDLNTYCMASSGSSIYVATTAGNIFLSTNNGTSWNKVYSGTAGEIISLAANGPNVYAGVSEYGPMYVSNNGGTTWREVYNYSSGNYPPNAFAFSGSEVFVGTGGDGVYLSEDSGTTWLYHPSGLDFKVISAMAVDSAGVFAGTQGGGVYFSPNNGDNWHPSNNGLGDGYITSLATGPGGIYAGSSTGIFSGGGIFSSGNNGATWNFDAGSPITNIPSLISDSAGVFAGAGTVYLSPNDGNTWQTQANGLLYNGESPGVTCLAVSGTNIYAGSEEGFYYSLNNGNTWNTPADSGFPSNQFEGFSEVYSVAAIGSYVFIGLNNYNGQGPGNLYYTTNNGASWDQSSGLTEFGLYTDVLSLNVNGTSLYAGTDYEGVFLSKDSAKTWTQLTTGVPRELEVNAITSTAHHIYLGTDSGVYTSGNNGASWTKMNTGLPTGVNITALGINGSTLYAGTQYAGVWQIALPDTICNTSYTSAYASLCSGSSYLYNGHTYTTVGVYNDTLQSAGGCDSIVALHLSLLAADTTSLTDTICAGTTYSFFGATLSQSGTYTHALQSVTGCDSLIVLHLALRSNPVTTITPAGPVTMCPGDNVMLDAGTGFSAYLWNTGATTETITATQAGSYHCAIASGTCQGLSDTVNVTVNPITASFTHVTSGDTVRFTSTGTGALIYLWNFGDNTISPFQDPTHVYTSNGSHTVTLTATDTYCGATDIQIIQTGCVAPVLTGNITGPLSVCLSVNIIYGIAPAANATSYTWVVPSYCTLIAGQGTDSITVRFLTGFHTGEIGVHATSCSENSSERLIFVTNAASAPSEIVGPVNAVCGGSTKTYSTPRISGVTSYTWTVTGATLLSGQGTDSIQVEFTSGYTSATISVMANGACGPSASKSVTITSTPPALTLNGSATGYCKQAAPVTLAVVPVAGATSYTWTVPTGVTIDNGQGARSITVTVDSNTFTSGDVTVYATNGCGNSPTNTLLISAAPAKPASIVGPSLLTAGDTYTDSVKPVPFATSYTWTVPAGWVVTGPTNTDKLIFTPDTVSGNVTVTANNECGSSAVLSTHYSVLKDGNITQEGPTTLGGIKVFPNPFSDRFEVQFETTENLSIHIRVYTIEGQLFSEQIQQTTTGTNQFYIDMNLAAPGIYIVSAIAGEETRVMRVLKQ